MRGNNRNDNRRASTVRDRSLFIPSGGGGGGGGGRGFKAKQGDI